MGVAQELQEQERRRKDPPDDPSNPTVDFHGEKRSNETHESTTDPDAKLSRNGKRKEALWVAMLALIGVVWSMRKTRVDTLEKQARDLAIEAATQRRVATVTNEHIPHLRQPSLRPTSTVGPVMLRLP
jgi:hypothetical protein